MLEPLSPGEQKPRFLLVILQLALSVFLGSLGVGILSAPITGPPVIAWLLRIFVALMFGGIALGSAYGAFRTLRGDAKKAREVPDELVAFCLVCGEHSPAELVCPVCGEAPSDRRAAVTVERKGWLGSAFLMAVSGALVCLGIFVGIGPFFDGERRLWALIAFAALGLLLASIGMVGLWGSVLVVVEAFRGGSSLSYRKGGTERLAWGSGQCRWGKLLFLEGHSRIVEPPLPKPKPDGGYRASPGDIRFAEMMATLDACAITRLSDVTTYDFCLGEKPQEGAPRTPRGPLSFSRKHSCKTFVALLPDADFIEDAPEDFYITGPEKSPERRAEPPLYTIVRQFFAPWLRRTQTLSEVKRTLEADPARRAQAEAHIQALLDAGVRLSPELVEALLARITHA